MYICKRCGWERNDKPQETWDVCPNCDNFDWMVKGERNNMQWTTEPPTVPGWYWAMYLDDEPWVVCVAFDGNKNLKYWEDGVAGALSLDRVSYWLGPLPVPELPKELKG